MYIIETVSYPNQLSTKYTITTMYYGIISIKPHKLNIRFLILLGAGEARGLILILLSEPKNKHFYLSVYRGQSTYFSDDPVPI